MKKITPGPAPMRTWLAALLLLGLCAALLGLYAANTRDGFDSLLDLFAG